MDGFAVFCLIGLVGFQGWVTRQVWQCNAYDREQKVAQTKFIWMLPLVGAVVAFIIYLDANKTLGG